MKKPLILLIGLTTTLTFSQIINDEGNGYTEIVSADSIKKADIYQKLKEWVGLNYKSANDVIQLDTEDKIIAKGNFTINYPNGSSLLEMVVSNNLIFSIKDNKYKIDLIPTEMYSPAYPTYKTKGKKLKSYISDKPLNLDEFKFLSYNLAEEMFINMGFNENKINKMLLDVDKINSDIYPNYLIAYSNFTAEIKNIYSSIKDNVLKKDEW